VNIIKILTDKIQGKAPKGMRRAKGWRKMRRVFIKKHPRCSVCYSKKKVEVHHKIPFHIAPELELMLGNLISLCENKKYGINCHLLIGHLGNYRRINMNVETDIFVWNKKIKGD
jgi:hypothetical protein